jgi:hypothetical protein
MGAFKFPILIQMHNFFNCGLVRNVDEDIIKRLIISLKIIHTYMRLMSTRMSSVHKLGTPQLSMDVNFNGGIRNIYRLHRISTIAARKLKKNCSCGCKQS